MSVEWRSTKDLRTREPFRSLFPVDPKVMQAIQEDMGLHGYDESQPVVATVWENDLVVVIDGHTRLRAARRNGINSVPVLMKKFSSVTDALEYAIHNQRDRRNITDADILRCVEALDKRKERGGDHGNQYTEPKEANAPSGAMPKKERSSEQTAAALGISARKVERTRTVLDHADEETKKEVLEGKKSLNKAYQETQTKRKAEKGASSGDDASAGIADLINAEQKAGYPIHLKMSVSEDSGGEQPLTEEPHTISGDMIQAIKSLNEKFTPAETIVIAYILAESCGCHVGHGNAFCFKKGCEQRENTYISSKKLHEGRRLLEPNHPIKSKKRGGKQTTMRAEQADMFAVPNEDTAASHQTRSVFNKPNDNIEWAPFSWNPVTGCKFGCHYCYARDIANRFMTEKFDPTFHEERLACPLNTPVPKSHEPGARNVFVGSMTDLFGPWVPDEWIEKVLDVCRKTSQWTYLFLTKNPKRLVDINWPANAWVGTTIDTQKRVEPALEAFQAINAPVSFVSCEPLLEDLTFPDFPFDWLIIGSQSRTSCVPAFQPKWEWVEHLTNQAREHDAQVYWKPNLEVKAVGGRHREYPQL